MKELDVINKVLTLLQTERRAADDKTRESLDRLIEQVHAFYMRLEINKRIELSSRLQHQAVQSFVQARLLVQDDTFTSNADLYAAWKQHVAKFSYGIDRGSAMKNNAFSRMLGSVMKGQPVRRARLQPLVDGKKQSLYGWSGLSLASLPTPGGITVEEVAPENIPDTQF